MENLKNEAFWSLYRRVVKKVQDALEISNSDAQGFVDAKESVLFNALESGLTGEAEVIEIVKFITHVPIEEKESVLNPSNFNIDWDFVEKYYPDYYSADEIAYADDLQKIKDGELEGNAARLWEDKFKGDLDAVEAEYNRVHVEIYKESIKSYLESLK